MKTFKIEFCDINGNDVYSVTKNFENLIEASMYAYLVLANSSDECESFIVIEL